LGFTRGNTLPHNIASPTATHRFSLYTHSTPYHTRPILLTHVHRGSRPSVRPLSCLFPNGIQLRRRRRPVTSAAGTLCRSLSLTIPRCVRACVCVHVCGGADVVLPTRPPSTPSSRTYPTALSLPPTPTHCFRLHHMLSSLPFALAWHLSVFLQLPLPPVVPAVPHRFPRCVLHAMGLISVYVLRLLLLHGTK
jgi:hypothetical protein